LTAALVVAIVVVARRHDGDRRSFVVAVVAALALTPIVWLHYLVLLVVPVALYRQRFSAAWAVPLLFWLLPGQENNGQIANILIAFGLAGATLVLASRRRAEPAPIPVLSTP
jgi:hypothetical protein